MYSGATPLDPLKKSKKAAYHFHFDFFRKQKNHLKLINQILNKGDYISIITEGEVEPIWEYLDKLKKSGLKKSANIKIHPGNNQNKGPLFTKETLGRVITTEWPDATTHDFFDDRKEWCDEVEQLKQELAVLLQDNEKELHVHFVTNNLDVNNDVKNDSVRNNDLDVNHDIQDDIMSNQAFDLILDKIKKYIDETQKKIDGYLTRYMVNTKLSLFKLLLAKALQTALIQLNKKDSTLIYTYMRAITLLNLAIEELSNKSDKAFSVFQHCPINDTDYNDIKLFFIALLENWPKDTRMNGLVIIPLEEILDDLSLSSNWDKFAAQLLLKINYIRLSPKDGAGKEYLPWRSSGLDKLMKEIYELIIDDDVIKEMQADNPDLVVPENFFRHL